jgi:hypothetical protein
MMSSPDFAVTSEFWGADDTPAGVERRTDDALEPLVSKRSLS